MKTRVLPLLVLACAGCGKNTTSFVFLEGASYRWVLANHRLSHVELGADEDGAFAAIVGGTSTTNVDAELPPTCDPDTCEELPFWDEAEVRVDWGRVDAPEAFFAHQVVELTADADGETAEAKVTIDRSEGEPISATIRSIRVSTDHPLDGDEACYNPQFGWLPTRLAVEVGQSKSNGDLISVPVTATFTAGNTLESIRQCIDEVIDRARVSVEVDLLVVAGGSKVETAEVSGAATFAYGDGPLNPAEQVPPPPQDIDLGLKDPVVGWSRLDWSFHIDDPDGRGAYLRSLDWSVGDDGAFGGATNYSPITQLSGFDYAFSGKVVGHEVGGTVTRGSIEATIPVELNGAQPVVHVIGKTH